jgi:hypothetical protein
VTNPSQCCCFPPSAGFLPPPFVSTAVSYFRGPHRSPLSIPHIGRTLGCSNRRRGKPPAPPYAPVQSLKKLLEVLWIKPWSIL